MKMGEPKIPGSGVQDMTKVSQNKTRQNVETTESSYKGFAGFFESTLRKFKNIMHALLLLPLYGVMALALGMAVAPALWFFQIAQTWLPTLDQASFWSGVFHYFCLGAFVVLSYLIYGFSALFIIPAINFILRTNLSEWRGPYYSLSSIRWYIHNGLTYLIRFTFLEFVTPTPFNVLFYQMMGMKVGRGVAINTTWISDPSLITLGHKVTLGGSVTLVGHYGQGGFLVLMPVKIGNGVTIGLKATVMGGAEIGDNAKILPHSVVLPKTKIPEGETWGGVPAQKVEIRKLVNS